MNRIKLLPLLGAICLLFAACGQSALPTKISAPLDQAVTDAILNENLIPGASSECRTESHTVLGADLQENNATVYVMVLYQEFSSTVKGGYAQTRSSHMPCALSFQKEGDTYLLTEYWIPTDGSDYPASIKAKYPASLYADALDTQAYIDGQEEECLGKAEAYFATKKAPGADV